MAVKKVPQSAQAIIKNFLAAFGLGSLGAWAWQRYAELGGGPNALNQISVEMVEQPQFNKRFPAYKILAERGQAMSPAEMINYEQTARQIFHAAGLPQGFYDQPDDFATLMVGSVSASELQERVQLAQGAALSAPQDVRDTLQRLYGIDSGALTAYYLNPEKALPVLQRQFVASQIGAASERTGVGALSVEQAEHIAALGVSDAQAQQTFGELGAQQGLFEAQVAGEDQIDLATQLSASFDNSAAARLRIRRRQEARVADFSGASGLNVQQGGVGGLGSTDTSVG